MTELALRPEEAQNTSTNIVEIVMGQNPEQQKDLRGAETNYGYNYERYAGLVFGEHAPEAIQQFAADLKQELSGERGSDPAFQLASLRTCLDLSQAVGRVAERSDRRYPQSGLNEHNSLAATTALGEAVQAVPAPSALVDLTKQKVSYVFGLYEQYPGIEADSDWRNYETDILGPVFRLQQSDGTREISAEAHPTLIAKGLVGFRDPNEHVALVAPVDPTEVATRPFVTYKRYTKLDEDAKFHLSSSDYDVVAANMHRATTIPLAATEPIGAAVHIENQPMLDLFQELHTPLVRSVIEQTLGVSLQEIPIEKQFDFLRFASTCTPDVFERASKTLHTIPEEQRPAVFDAFMSTKFGSDYSESILTIAEKYPTDQAVEIFETIGTFNDGARTIASWYESYDPQLAQSIELAMRERLSDALVALEELGREGHLDIDVSPGRNSENYVSDGRFEMHLQSPGEGIEIVKALGKSLKLIQEVVTAEDVQAHQVNVDATHFLMYRFSSEQQGDALLYIRPEGAKGHDSHLEYGNRSGVEASISFIVNPSDPQHLDIYKDPQGVSIRFDREGRRTDESPFSDERDPTRADGSMSVDISSLMGDGRHMPVKIGRFIAAGNLLRAAKTGGHESLHHNNNYFDQDRYGTAEGFAKLGIYTAHMAAATIELQRSGSHASPYPSIPAARR